MTVEYRSDITPVITKLSDQALGWAVSQFPKFDPPAGLTVMDVHRKIADLYINIMVNGMNKIPGWPATVEGVEIDGQRMWIMFAPWHGSGAEIAAQAHVNADAIADATLRFMRGSRR